jgi:hypothetical protein
MAFQLSYLFECHFNDGTILQQTQEDVSSTEPTRSAFFDVIQRLNDVQLFGVYNDVHTAVVDLRDGHFEIDGVVFTISGDELPEGDHELRLIYFRRHRHTLAMGEIPDELKHETEYHIGWQTTVEGKNYQRTIALL